MLIYLTYAEPPSGVFSSQVADVIRYVNRKEQAGIRLLAFISLHDFRSNRTRIKKESPDAIVLPMLPKATYWKFNSLALCLLCLFLRPKAILARNVIAANMALKARKFKLVKKVCFDGRGAIAAEWSEYDVKVVDSWKKAIGDLESRAVMESDFRIAVTEKLVDYWHERYGYSSGQHVVIPCTLNSNFVPRIPRDEEKAAARKSLNLDAGDTVLAYAGSTAGWQSFSTLHRYLEPFLKNDQRHKIIFLSKKEENIEKLSREFPGQILQQWVNHADVPGVLSACDMGILLREDSITNRVASPTKFAEYLSAGLPVIISEKIGDYSDFVRKNDCGLIANGSELPSITGTDEAVRARMIGLVNANFTKEAQAGHYRELLSNLQ
ncbi:MAG: hypothetical protein JNL88_10130 [Bacteroidia bacterium]|nr:hypothetical protein [Bacteroidia bacterium]